MPSYQEEVLALSPTGYWRLGEPSGTNAVDLGSGLNDGTYTNTPTLGATGLLTGDSDTAVTFVAASSEYVALGDINDFVRTDSFTICAWINIANLSTGAIYSKLDAGGGTNRGYAFFIDGGTEKLEFIFRETTTSNEVHLSTTTVDVTDSATHFVAVTYDGTSSAAGSKIYIDGVEVATTTIADTLSSYTGSPSNDFIGTHNNTTNPFNGTIDEVAVFNKVLTQKELARLHYTGLGTLDRFPLDVLGLDPVGYWRLGEPSGTNAVDESISANDGTYNNTPTLAVAGAVSEDTDTAVLFDRLATEYVGMGNITELSFDYNDPFSVAGFFKTSDTTNTTSIASKMENAGNYRGWQVSVDDTGALRFQLVNTLTTTDLVTATTNTTMDDGEWHFFVLTYNGNNLDSGVTFYVDGVEEAKTNIRDGLGANVITNTSAFNIGARAGAGLPYDGTLDEIAVYATELTSAEALFLYDSSVYVTPIPGLDADYRNTVLGLCPLGYWRLGEPSGTNAVDETLRNDGTYTNTPTLGVTGALTGDTDTAVTFAQATSEYVTMGDVLDITYDTAFSLSIWGKTTYSATTQALTGKMDHATPYRGYELRQETTGALSLFIRYSETTNDRILIRTTATTFNDGNWHHVVATYTGSGTAAGVSIYIDGVDQALTTVTDNLGTNSLATAVSFNVGARNGGGEYFDGSLDEAAMFGSALTAKDVAAMYYMGLGKTGNAYEVLKLNPVGFWRLGEASGTNAVDETVSGNDGTYTNTPTLGVTGALTGDTDTAVTFASATSEYVTMGDVLDFDRLDPFTLCVWFKTGTAATQSILRKSRHAIDFIGYGINILSTGAINFTLTNDSVGGANIINVKTTATTFGDDAWHHVVVTYDGSSNASGVAIYIDGINEALTITYDTLTSTTLNTYPLQLGARNSTDIYFNGELDEAAIFGTELTAQEAHDIYTYGKQYRSAQSSFTSAMWEARPIGWWKLGEASGTVAADELGLNDGTYNNTPTLGVAGAIASEPGDTAITVAAATSEDVSMGDVLGFEYNLPFTISYWYKTTATSLQHIVGKQQSTGNFVGVSVATAATGAVDLQVVNTPVTNLIRINTTATTFNDGNWHHVVVTYDGSTNASGVNIYVDGVDEALTTVSDNLSATIASAANLSIASRNSAAGYFDGSVDEVAIFDHELTAVEVARIYWEAAGYSEYSLAQLINQPVGYWRLGETSGTNAVDVIGTNDGTYTNTPTLGVAGAITNDTDTAVTLASASSEYVTMGDVLDFERTATFSISAWFKTNTAANQAIVSKEEGTPAYAGYDLRVNSTGGITFNVSGDATGNILTMSTTANTFADDTWHFVMATYDGSSSPSGVTIYVDGASEVLSTDVDTLSATTLNAAALSIGRRSDASLYFDGELDEVAVYARELTAPEICEIYFASLLTYTTVGGGAAQYSEVVSETPSIGSLVGATADHAVTDASDFTQVIISHWGRTVSESFNWEVGIGIITTITESTNFAPSADAVRYMIGSAVEAVQFALTENIETAKGVLEALATNDVLAASTILQGNLSETLSYADVIRLTWDQLETETVNVTDSNTVYAQKAAALAELFVSAGIVSTIHKAAGIIAEAIILQDLVERFFELSVVDTVHLTDAEATLYRAVAANIEAAAMADSLTGTRRLSLLVSDALTGGDTDILNVICRTLAEDDVIFGGAISLPDGVFSAIVLNTESMGISEYSNYPFNSFGKLENDYLGASDTDIYKLTGDDDAGTDIDAVIRTGMTNFGTNVFKRVPRAYLGYTSDGGLIMKTISTSGGTKTERWYELTPRTGDHASAAPTAARIKLGRGIKATYWQFELINKLGSDFDIDMLQLYPMILSRRV